MYISQLKNRSPVKENVTLYKAKFIPGKCQFKKAVMKSESEMFTNRFKIYK